MYTKIDARPIKSIVFPGNNGTRTKFQEVEHSPQLSFKSLTDGNIYHIFVVYHYPVANSNKFIVNFYMGKEFTNGIIYPPISISSETVENITKILNSEV